MKYDLETLIDRRGHDAIAVDAIGSDVFKGEVPRAPKEGFDCIPLWVADMNFPTAKSVTDAIIARAQHPAFGYFSPSKEYFKAIIDWHKRRKGVTDLKPEHIGYENGVLGGVLSAMKVLAAPGDAVLLHSPTYVGFTKTLTNNGYNIVHSPLVKDEEGTWRMDYEDMDRKIKDNHIHVAVFCNPHNPCGRAWTEEEIRKAMEVYEKNDVWVISDEIWSDLLMNGHQYTPVQSVSEWAKMHTCAFYAPSKTFNLAGLVGSYSVIYNKYIRERVHSVGNKTVYNSMNVLSMHALIGAYSDEGDDWLNQILEVISANVNFAADYVRDHFEGVSVFRTEGTYMMFLDCSEWLEKHNMDKQALMELGWDHGIAWQDGKWFQDPNSIRLNLASPTHRIQEAFRRMDQYVFNRE